MNETIARFVSALLTFICALVFAGLICHAVFGYLTREMLIGAAIGTGLLVQWLFFWPQGQGGKKR